MRKIILTLLASAALAMPATAPAMAQNNPQNQNQKSQAQQQSQQQPNQQQAKRHSGQKNQQLAANEPISAQRLGGSGVRRIQRALDKEGFHAGRADGIYGSETRAALREFQNSKGIQGNGQINQQTLSDLGVKVSSKNQNSMGNQIGNSNPAPQSAEGQITSKSAKISGTPPSFAVGKLTVQGRPNGMVAMLNQDEKQDVQLAH